MPVPSGTNSLGSNRASFEAGEGDRSGYGALLGPVLVVVDEGCCIVPSFITLSPPLVVVPEVAAAAAAARRRPRPVSYTHLTLPTSRLV